MIDTQDTLLGFAEVAVALAGFAAIVVVFKRKQNGKWTIIHADRFHGMVVHAVCAVVFCLLPTVIDTIVQDPVTTLHIACALLGVQLIVHGIGVIFALAINGWAKGMLSFGVLIGLFQFAAFTDWAVQREFQIYLVGIIWHILQAGVLFVMLVWIPAEDIEQP